MPYPTIRMLGTCLLLIAAALPAAAWKLPMYRMFNAQYNDWFYTTSESQRAIALGSYGYVDRGTAFYVDDGSTPGATRFYRFYKGLPQTDHFYTHDLGEVSTVKAADWAEEGNEGYVFASQVADTVPIYRLSHFDGATSDLMHYYTPNYSEVQAYTRMGWGLDATIFYAFATGDTPPPTPRMVHATQLTASCADKYCVKITGYDFAPDAYIEMRSGSANGPIIWNESNYVRGTSGNATTLEVVLTNPGVRGTLDHPDGIWFWVVNPGNPATRGGGLNVIRDNPFFVHGYVDLVDSAGVQGWVCTDRDYNASLPVTVRLDSDSGEVVTTGYTNPGARLDAAYLCGGVGGGSIFLNWPSRYLDGRTRDIYTIVRFDTIGALRYPNALINNSPVTYTFPDRPWEATATAPVNLTVSRGARWATQLAFTNRGSRNWGSGGQDAVFISQTTAFSWATSSVGLPYQPVVPDGSTTVSVGGTAPTAPGSYTVKYKVRHGASSFFGTPANINLTVQ